MAQEEHTHNWHYNEAERIRHSKNGDASWSVIRFCISCKKIERIELNTTK